VEARSPSAYVAEFIGTFALVFFITAVLSVSGGLGYVDFAVIGLLHAFVLMMLIHTLGATSGGHFNPAVTAAMAAVRRIAPGDALIYILVQLAGGVAGTLVTKLLLQDEGKGGDYGAAIVSQKFLQGKALSGLLAEGLATFFLMWAIMGVAANDRGAKDWAGFVIGATLGFCIFVFGPLTGGSLNPARWFGPALVSGTWTDAWVYIVAPVLGAVLAAVLYTALVIAPQGRAKPATG